MTALVSFIKEIYQIWVAERPTQLAAALAYYGMFSLVPIFLIAFTIAGIFIDSTILAEETIVRLEQFLGPDLAQAIQTMLTTYSIDLPDVIARWTWIASIVGFLSLLWVASSLFTQIHFAMNTLWGVPKAPKNLSQGLIKQRLLPTLIVISLGLLLVVVAVANFIITWLDSVFDIPSDYAAIRYLLLISITVVTFAVIYKYIPNVQLRWQDVWLGAVVAALLETLGVVILGLVMQLGLFDSAAATVSSYLLLLVIMYYMAQIFLLGVIITRVYTSKNKSGNYGAAMGDPSKQDMEVEV